jgi:hypothetical protein
VKVDTLGSRSWHFGQSKLILWPVKVNTLGNQSDSSPVKVDTLASQSWYFGSQSGYFGQSKWILWLVWSVAVHTIVFIRRGSIWAAEDLWLLAHFEPAKDLWPAQRLTNRPQRTSIPCSTTYRFQQGNQIGRIFAFWAIGYFGQFFGGAQSLGQLFSTMKYFVLIWTKK